MKPRLFIGSSVEGLKVAECIQELLKFDVFPRVWTQGNFNLNNTTLDDLISAVKKHDFAIFIFSPDDVTILRDKQVHTVRDNVIFELGLFMGYLGKENVFFLVPEGINDLHLPTDLLGISAGSYFFTKDIEDLLAGLGPVCNQIRRQINPTVSTNGISLAGKWCERWSLTDTKSFDFNEINEDKDVEIMQRGNQVIAEFRAGGRVYKLEGQIQDYFLTGIWKDSRLGANYHGSFQLRIGINAKTMHGLWVGFDSELNKIKQNYWEWKRIDARNYPSQPQELGGIIT